MNKLKDFDSFKQLKPLNTRETRLEAGIDTWCHCSDVDNVVDDDDVHGDDDDDDELDNVVEPGRGH